MLILKGLMASASDAASKRVGSRLNAPASTIPIAAVPKSWRRSWLITSELDVLAIVNLPSLSRFGFQGPVKFVLNLNIYALSCAPFRRPAAPAAIHLITRVLRELHADAIDAQSQRLDAGVDECRGQFGPLFRRAAAPYVAGQLRRPVGHASAAAPNPAFPQFAECKRHQIRCRLHDARVLIFHTA